ncbi:TAXI family TRAP transporter solute-binding subunit [Elioraea sp.]|uniref:TAXI family TRAP transporter solute-binding subunit n=1 Tax=Elioraea sp. TaxID=2185103 RepID=UPI0021DF3AED|nr:TAXI family TRAP transporter solute-binding subunit [Elioraea sp.]GIX11949.1 MAG: C4-dicarboxylate ABC transporter substrate-binding protein [Elioraea sp.]
MRLGLKTTALAVMLLAAPLTGADAQTMRFMTGPQGGVWVPLGGALKNMWEQAIPGISVTAMPGAGVANIRGVDEGRAQIGFGNSITTVDGLNGAPPFPRKVTKVCNLATLYPQYFQMIALATAGVNRVEDLRGKQVVIQPRGNTAEVVTAQILQVAGLTYNDIRPNFQASYTDAVGLLRDGNADAFTLGTAIPASSVMDLASARDIKVVDLAPYIEGLRKLNPGFVGVPIPAGTYPKQTQTVTVPGYFTHVVVSCDLPEAMVHDMVKTMASNIDAMAAVFGGIRGLTPKQMAMDIGVPLHPGAERFYKQAGAL